jgi:hypothetical protein
MYQLFQPIGAAMKYELRVTIHRLDGTVAEKDSVLKTRAETLFAIAQELRQHDDFVSSFVFTVVADRS